MKQIEGTSRLDGSLESAPLYSLFYIYLTTGTEQTRSIFPPQNGTRRLLVDRATRILAKHLQVLDVESVFYLFNHPF